VREEWPDRADDNKDQPEREPSRAAHLIAHVLGAGPILDKQQTFLNKKVKMCPCYDTTSSRSAISRSAAHRETW